MRWGLWMSLPSLGHLEQFLTVEPHPMSQWRDNSERSFWLKGRYLEVYIGLSLAMQYRLYSDNRHAQILMSSDVPSTEKSMYGNQEGKTLALAQWMADWKKGLHWCSPADKEMQRKTARLTWCYPNMSISLLSWTFFHSLALPTTSSEQEKV